LNNKIIYKVYFSIFGNEFNLNVFNKIIGVIPSDTYIKGEMGKYARYKETSWSYVIEEYENLNLDDLTRRLLRIFDNKKELLKKYAEKNNLEIRFSVVFNIYDSIIPSLYIDKKFLNFLSFLNCDIDFDGYLLSVG